VWLARNAWAKTQVISVSTRASKTRGRHDSSKRPLLRYALWPSTRGPVVAAAPCNRQRRLGNSPNRSDVVARIINQLGIEKVMFEGADPPVFKWYVKNYGNDINLFVDHGQIVQLEALRSGIWGTKSPWVRIQSLRGAR
jgi:hypothetical protein